MILARLIPKHSKKYENFNNNISVYAELIEKYNVINLFSVWIITASGFSYLLGQIDRYSYWDWSGFNEGILRLILSTILYYVASKTEMLKLGNVRLTYLDLFFNVCKKKYSFPQSAKQFDTKISELLGSQEKIL